MFAGEACGSTGVWLYVLSVFVGSVCVVYVSLYVSVGIMGVSAGGLLSVCVGLCKNYIYLRDVSVSLGV